MAPLERNHASFANFALSTFSEIRIAPVRYTKAIPFCGTHEDSEYARELYSGQFGDRVKLRA